MENDKAEKQDMRMIVAEMENVEEEDDVVGDVPAPLQLFEPYTNETSIGEIF
jgi:hypothetical protein